MTDIRLQLPHVPKSGQVIKDDNTVTNMGDFMDAMRSAHPLTHVPGTLQKVLLPEDFPNSEFASGAATPKVFYDSIANKTRMLFTGFNTNADPSLTNVRHLFLADIDPNLKVSNIAKLVPANSFGANYEGFGSAECYYDLHNQQWIFTASLYNPGGGNTVGMFTMDKHFGAIVNTLQVIRSKTDPLAAWDSGMSLIQGYGRSGILTWHTEGADPFGMGRRVLVKAKVDDFTARPWTVTIQPLESVLTYPYHSMVSPDIHYVSQHKGGLLLLSEAMNSQMPWNILVGFMPEVPEADAYWYTKEFLIGRQRLVPNHAAGIVNAGMPFYTNVMGFPALFFCQFRDTFADKYSFHEIWCYRLPHDWLETSLFPGGAFLQLANSTPKWHPTFNHTCQIVGFLKAGVSDRNIVIEQCADVNDGIYWGKVASQTVPISDGGYAKVTLDPALPWVRAYFSDTTGLDYYSHIRLEVS